MMHSVDTRKPVPFQYTIPVTKLMAMNLVDLVNLVKCKLVKSTMESAKWSFIVCGMMI